MCRLLQSIIYKIPCFVILLASFVDDESNNSSYQYTKKYSAKQCSQGTSQATFYDSEVENFLCITKPGVLVVKSCIQCNAECQSAWFYVIIHSSRKKRMMMIHLELESYNADWCDPNTFMILIPKKCFVFICWKTLKIFISTFNHSFENKNMFNKLIE